MQDVYSSRGATGLAKSHPVEPRRCISFADKDDGHCSSCLLPGLSFYNLWYPVQNLNGPIKVFPSYYAYLFITEAIGKSKSVQIANVYPGRQANGSSITTALGDVSAGQLVAYGLWDKDGPFKEESPSKLALLNLQIFNKTQDIVRPKASIDISAFIETPGQRISIRRLQAPGADVKEGSETTWAGQSYGSGLASGEIREEISTNPLVTLQASEAALVSLVQS